MSESGRSASPTDEQQSQVNEPRSGPPGVRGIIALLVIACISLLLHVYPVWRAFTAANVMSSWLAVLIGVGAALVMIGILAVSQTRHLDRLGAVAVTWLGVVFQLLVWTVLGEVVRFGLWVADVPHRGELGTLIVVGWTILVLAFGLRTALSAPRVRPVEVTLPRLHPDLDGLRIVQITDTHLSRILGTRWMARRVDQVNEIDADIYCHTGDLADGDPKLRLAAVEHLGRLRGQHRFFITGNHEYFSDAAYWGAQMTRLGWTFLHNEHVEFQRGAGRLIIAGIDDPTGTASGLAGHGPRLDAALDGADPDALVLLLAHQPKQSRDAAAHGVDLQLAGHTHGGQMWPFHYLVRADQKYVSGLHSINDRTQLYVSRGTGFWGPPFRIGAPPEITLLTLRSVQRTDASR